MMTIVPTPDQYELLASHKLGYATAVKLASAFFTEKRMDVDSGFVFIRAAVQQQERFNATPLVRANARRQYEDANYRMLRGK